MLLLLIIPLLISGFVLVHSHPYYYYKLHRYEGQYLYIQTSRLGLGCFSISLIINIIIYYILMLFCFSPSTPSHIHFLAKIFYSNLFTTEAESIRLSWIAWVSAVSILAVPKAWAGLYTAFSKYTLDVKSREAHNLLIIKKILKDSPLDSFLLNAILYSELVMLSMSDRKVYVGYLETMGEPNEIQAADQEVSIQPVMSGYRCKDSLTVTFTTLYQEVIQACESNPVLITTLRQENIVSASLFDQAVFQEFESNASNKSEGSRLNKDSVLRKLIRSLKAR